MIGTRLAHYEITAHLGSGGMGEVYQATDTKLGRSVAIKLLPPAFASDPERLSRFRREAQALAALNHLNIAQIYGIEDSGGTPCIVMELVDGETLQARIGRGPIGLPEALAIAKQIAEALEAAHERGVIHRDLKPGNIMLADGKVKVLDFGLAKAYDTPSANTDVANSPTLVSMAATSAGVILGTAAYMSPEQAKGRAVDRRTDIFAFGCVLYEMLTAKRAFDGEDVTDILGAVLRVEPDWNQLPDGVPAGVRRLLRLPRKESEESQKRCDRYPARSGPLAERARHSGAFGDRGSNAPRVGTRDSRGVRALDWKRSFGRCNLDVAIGAGGGRGHAVFGNSSPGPEFFKRWPQIRRSVARRIGDGLRR